MRKVIKIQSESNRQKRLICGLVFILTVCIIPREDIMAAPNTSPTIRLFPTTVVENIKHTGEAAKAMEADLQTVIDRLNQQEALYTASKCEGADAEPGCSEIAGQLSQTYLEMLDLMEARLPGMEESVRTTGVSLEKRIRKELGHKTTPRGLQKLLQRTPQKSVEAPRYKRPSRRLSEKFRQYYNLVAMRSIADSNGSLAAVAAEIYLDTREVQELIALTRDEISRAKLMIDLDQAYGIITPEMFEMVAQVKTIIFGESVEAGTIPGPPPGSTKAQYQSPLEE
ncbi:MAG: hypothetical protein PVI94_24010 [Desulfobacterales bacterium]|jgi:hypothetical protein